MLCRALSCIVLFCTVLFFVRAIVLPRLYEIPFDSLAALSVLSKDAGWVCSPSMKKRVPVLSARNEVHFMLVLT